MENIDLDRTIDSKKIYQGSIINVKIDNVLLKTGVKASREVVEHRPAVAIVPVSGGQSKTDQPFAFLRSTSQLAYP